MMKGVATVLAPQWWSLKNRLFRSGSSFTIRGLMVVLLAAGFWAAILHFLPGMLVRLEGMEGDVGNIIALKGLSLLLMLTFFMIVFSSLLAGMNTFYLSNDLPVVLSSPVSLEDVFIAKWAEAVFKSSWMILFAIVPVFIAFGMHFKSSPLYYAVLPLVMAAFVAIPAGAGIILCICLMASVPARRAKNIFIILALIAVAILFLLFRVMRPERFANPEWFANMTIFLSEMKLPVAAVLPSMWTTETLHPFLASGGSSPLLFVLLLMTTPPAVLIIGQWLFSRLHYTGYVKAQFAQKPRSAASGSAGAGLSFEGMFLMLAGTFFTGPRRAMIEKDITAFFRNVGQASQLVLLLAIVIIYLFSIRALPVEWDQALSTQLKYIISFFNIGLVGFVTTSVASRLVLPSVSNEGRSFWILRVSPVSMRQFLWTKFLAAFLPLLFLGEVLIIVSNYYLGVKPWFMVLGSITCLLLVSSVTGLAVGLGAYHARFSLDDKDREQSGVQGAAYMMAALAVIAVTIALELVPISGLFVKEVSEAELTLTTWAVISAFLTAVVVVNGLVLWLAMRKGEKRLTSLE